MTIHTYEERLSREDIQKWIGKIEKINHSAYDGRDVTKYLVVRRYILEKDRDHNRINFLAMVGRGFIYCFVRMCASLSTALGTYYVNFVVVWDRYILEE